MNKSKEVVKTYIVLLIVLIVIITILLIIFNKLYESEKYYFTIKTNYSDCDSIDVFDKYVLINKFNKKIYIDYNYKELVSYYNSYYGYEDDNNFYIVDTELYKNINISKEDERTTNFINAIDGIYNNNNGNIDYFCG